MKLVMTLLVRDEADIVDAQLAYHLNAGVDFVIATDNRSQDGTTEILEAYEREGCLRLIREPGDDMQQGPWVTRMAQLAAAEYAAARLVPAQAPALPAAHARAGRAQVRRRVVGVEPQSGSRPVALPDARLRRGPGRRARRVPRFADGRRRRPRDRARRRIACDR